MLPVTGAKLDGAEAISKQSPLPTASINMAKADNSSRRRVALISLLLAATVARSNAFVPSSPSRGTFTQSPSAVVAGSKTSSPVRPATTGLRMGLDLVTYLRTEWISAALCTNQTPRSADVCLQLGTEDGRAGKFNYHFSSTGGADNGHASYRECTTDSIFPFTYL